MYDEQILVKRLKEGDEKAFAWLIEQYSNMVLHVAYGFLQDYQEAEDLMQEVFVAVYENIAHFRSESNLKTWIYRIAINKSLNQQRKLKWKTWMGSIEDYLLWQHKTAENTTPQILLIHQEQMDAIEKALQKLPSNQRTAFILHKYDDLPHAEIAKIMNLSIPAVESLIHRAKLNLQKLLADFGNKKSNKK
ncbi:MAG TPA: RNA polymerase sigma factor [Bacteroidales bacterium]|nr:RNA polymerase sigma factor [Bacteroidales bacterium]HOK98758.1 RNA polymerase sigma factor [Bacteroidales bacterium]HPO65649.1 RNA polymerase sigma factor [Bacteroidales bacterium]